jgi:hypothetical protein
MYRLNLINAYKFSNNQNLLKGFGIVNASIARNLRYYILLLSTPEYYENGINYIPADPHTKKNQISSTGAFVAYSGLKTG